MEQDEITCFCKQHQHDLFPVEKGSRKRTKKSIKQMEFVCLPDDVLVVGNAIRLPPFRRDLLTYDRDVKEALGIFLFLKKFPFYFVG